MKRIQHISLLTLVGTLLVLAIVMPAGPRSENGREHVAPPRTASYPDYLYTIGVVGESGTDNLHFDLSWGVAVNGTGHLYVADWYNHRVQVFDNAGTYQYTIGTGSAGSGIYEFNYPCGVAVNATGYLYVADSTNHRVQVFDNAGAYQYTIGTGSGSGNYEFIYPYGVAVNATGHLYVADSQNNRLQVFDNAGAYQYTIGTGFGSGNYEFYWPYGVAVNATGHLYVADTYNHRVQVFDSAGIFQYTLATGLSYPCGVAVNANGRVYVADTLNNRVLVFDNAGISQCTIGTGNPGSGNDELIDPRCVAVNATGHLYVTDSSNYRVQVFGIPAPSGLSISIDGGATETGSTSVTLTLSATNATQMCFSNNGTTYTDWETNDTTKAWVLDGGPGPKTVYFKARCDLSEAAPVFDNIIYILPPSGLTIAIAGGVADTSSTSVTLTLSVNGATEMCFSNNGTTYTDWEMYGTARAWVLDGGPGPKTVYFNARNSTIEAEVPISDTITYRLPPTGLSISINGGAAETTTTSVTLTLSATGATEMCFSNDGVTWSAWESFATTKTWSLEGDAGPKTVYFKARNGTIDAAAPATDIITYTPGEGIPGFPVAMLLVVTGLGTLFLRRRAKLAPRA